jgi:TolB-like protein/cytochrome c-type biogenesis protein CcmH/NrfG
MKQCPQCSRIYPDQSLNYCLDDGSSLLEVSAASDWPATAILPSDYLPGDSPTRLFTAPGSAPAPASNSIAVLPFVNMSRGDEGDYFSDGLAEELLNVLSKIRGLRVAARTSAFSFKGKQITVAEIGRTLNVSSVLEGSVRLAGDRVRISVQLINVGDGYQLWSEKYDRTMDDIFAVQDDIAESVVEELRARLEGDNTDSVVKRQVASEVAVAVKGRAEDPEAQRLMLLGRYLLDRTTREDTAKAIDHFREALAIDPGYALCWAELGRAYSIQAGRAWVPVEEGFSCSRDAAERALALEPELGEAHAQLGRIKIAHDWDFTGAEESYRRAIKFAPGNSSVLDGAAVLAYKSGRLAEAIDLSRRVLAQDPLSAAYWHNLGLACHAAGDLAGSERAYRRSLELAPHRNVSAALLALVLNEQGRTEDAFAAAAREPDEFWRLWALAILHHLTGNSGANNELCEIIDRHADGNGYQIAEIYSMKGDIDEAFEWLTRAVDERDPGATHARVNPRFLSMHDDERWEPLLERIGFRS